MAFVYRFLNENNKIIYIGKTVNLMRRMKEHDHLTEDCYKKVVNIEYTECETEYDSLILERYLIAKIKPKFNKIFKCHDLSINIKEFDNIPWAKFPMELFTFKLVDKRETITEVEEIEEETARVCIKDLESEDILIRNRLKHLELALKKEDMENDRRKRNIREKHRLTEEKRKSMTKKEKEIALKELIKKRRKG